ncbi:hypothetical protein CEY09_30210 [Achromobacter marplatensis]|uniref:Phage abortive infection protein n=1 Tax=Achromobacter marplatensis TaxID=470868 RepID=A0ABX9FWF3_9BURK|nr:putative phage abortive infection protein [Achromobacter marplatensis]OWT55563.1 hypothetical protein CEY09_30210 [Achromobacter marplatensis]RBP11276.1 putative phage abortive infection protein [Achromobacter marplatensis]CAB3712124.1 hypothetical protein LMG26219_05986 [Achromobacter marplatensis]
MTDTQKKTALHQKPSRLVWVPVVAALLLVGAYVAYFGVYKSAPMGQPESWGQFGDFLGGLLNPVVGVVTVTLLVRTLLSQQRAIEVQGEELELQRHELQLQRAEAAKSTAALDAQHKAIVLQSFEQTFFAWLASYRSMVGNLVGNSHQLNGAQHLVALCQPFRENQADKTREQGIPLPDSNPVISYVDGVFDYLQAGDGIVVRRVERAVMEFDLVYRNNHSTLGPLFRTLYRLLDWVDRSPLSNQEKWHYIAIARSQLSWGEMFFLAFNGLTPRGSNFVPLMNKYAILDNLEGYTDGLVLVMREAFLKKPPTFHWISANSWRYNAKTFSSPIAKLELGIVEAKDL